MLRLKLNHVSKGGYWCTRKTYAMMIRSKTWHALHCKYMRSTSDDTKSSRDNHFNMMTSPNGNIFRVTGPLCWNSPLTGAPVTGEMPSQRPVRRSFDVFFDLCLNKQVSEQSRRWWFETPSRPLWSHCNEMISMVYKSICKYIWTSRGRTSHALEWLK